MTLDTNLVGFEALQDNKSGAAGKIRRDGTSVRIGFLTTATGFGGARSWQDGAMGSYNQRLTIVNHGSNAAEYRLGDFAAEDGVTVEGTDMATGMIPGKGSCGDSGYELDHDYGRQSH